MTRLIVDWTRISTASLIRGVITYEGHPYASHMKGGRGSAVSQDGAARHSRVAVRLGNIFTNWERLLCLFLRNILQVRKT